MNLAHLGRISRIGALLFLGLAAGRFAGAAPLDADIQRRVREATFEVVIPKPAKETVTYDKNWQELIPFQMRNDKYVAIGTAFSVGSGRYVTAMHVLFATIGDARGEPLLRDAAGNLYPIAKVVKGSSDQDFIVFTLAKAPASTAALELEEKPELNETVYAVGNALGEGIVMREGNYTSDTPEDESGRWNWLRFSAPISGGNSGGPLVDGKGKVVGIVRAKRTTENTLNFATPISLVMKAPDNLATADSRSVTGLLMTEKTKSGRFKMDLPLPKSFADFSAAYMKAADDFNAAQLQALQAENAADTFPRGTGSERYLRSLYARSTPAVIGQNSSGVWGVSQLTYTRLDLGHDGWQDSTNFKGILFYHRRKPDDIELSRWLTDAVLPGETVLKASPATIHVGGENAKIVSIGAPEVDEPFTDVWGRVWRLRVWHTVTWFGSSWQAEFMLPVPDGSVGFASQLGNFGKNGALDRMKLLTGFVAVAYEGKLSEWTKFLQQKAVLPRQITQPLMQIDYGHSLNFDDGRMSVAMKQELLKIDADTRLRLEFGYTPAGTGATLDAGGFVVFNNDDKTEANVYRHTAPPKSAPEESRKEWTKRLRHEHPYDAVATTVNGKQAIATVYGAPNEQPAPDALYTFYYRAETGTAQEAMKAKLDLLMKDVKVKAP